MEETMTHTEAKQFWQTLARDEPAKALALARECPKVAGRWRELADKSWVFGTEQWRRGDVAEVGSFNVGGPVFFYAIGGLKTDPNLTFDSRPAAQSACDAKLLELGYLLEGGE
jgi:hypothetical protein